MYANLVSSCNSNRFRFDDAFYFCKRSNDRIGTSGVDLITMLCIEQNVHAKNWMSCGMHCFTSRNTENQRNDSIIMVLMCIFSAFSKVYSDFFLKNASCVCFRTVTRVVPHSNRWKISWVDEFQWSMIFLCQTNCWIERSCSHSL